MPLYEVIPHLFVADFESAKDYISSLTLQEKPYIINCTKDLPMLSQHGIRLAVDDNRSATSMREMFNALPQITDAIHERVSHGRNVLVHCQAGRQRSAAAVSAYLIRHHKYTLEDAVRHVRDKKPDAFFWEVNFRDALEWFAILEGSPSILDT